MKSYLTIVIIFGWVIPQSDTLLPIDLVRVVFLAPSTLVLQTPSVSWLALITTLKVLALSFWLGLPRIPQRRPIRHVMQDESYNASGSWIPLDTLHMALYLDEISKLDRNDCVSRLACHLESFPDGNLTFVQTAILKLIKLSSSSPWNYSSVTSPRKHLINAAYFGQTTKCFKCCEVLYRTCTLDTGTLLKFI